MDDWEGLDLGIDTYMDWLELTFFFFFLFKVGIRPGLTLKAESLPV